MIPQIPFFAQQCVDLQPGHVAQGVSVNNEATFHLGDRINIKNLTIDEADRSRIFKGMRVSTIRQQYANHE